MELQHADHAERHVLDPDDLSDRVNVPEQGVHHGLAQQSHLGRGFGFLVGEGPALASFQSRMMSRLGVDPVIDR